jgi:hypothetical protein
MWVRISVLADKYSRAHMYRIDCALRRISRIPVTVREGNHHQHLDGYTYRPGQQRLKQLEAENDRLKRLVAEQLLANEALKQVLVKRGLG